jgi:hypothetical protein
MEISAGDDVDDAQDGGEFPLPGMTGSRKSGIQAQAHMARTNNGIV